MKQPSLPLPRPAQPSRVPAERSVEVEEFEFVPGPECEPRGLESVPEWLRIGLIDD